jgi:DNA-3-methyladenine glycosylase
MKTVCAPDLISGVVLPAEFYAEAPDRVAQRLLGKLLVRRPERAGEETTAGRIVEVEAYFGADDPAAHAFAGKTARNAVLFGPPGVAYVYFIYGMHYCLNFSCEPEGQGAGVLIRALEPVLGLETMARRRGLAESARPRLLTSGLLTSGPGKLCQAMGITRAVHNGVDVTDAASALMVVDDGYAVGEIEASPRIGIKKAAERLLRYSIAGNRFVSG